MVQTSPFNYPKDQVLVLNSHLFYDYSLHLLRAQDLQSRFDYRVLFSETETLLIMKFMPINKCYPSMPVTAHAV